MRSLIKVGCDPEGFFEYLGTVDLFSVPTRALRGPASYASERLISFQKHFQNEIYIKIIEILKVISEENVNTIHVFSQLLCVSYCSMPPQSVLVNKNEYR